MLGALDAFLLALVVVIMRHVKPKVKDTKTGTTMNTKAPSSYHWFKEAPVQEKNVDCLLHFE